MCDNDVSAFLREAWGNELGVHKQAGEELYQGFLNPVLAEVDKQEE